MEPKKVFLSPIDIDNLLNAMCKRIIIKIQESNIIGSIVDLNKIEYTLYGIPRGGVSVALALVDKLNQLLEPAQSCVLVNTLLFADIIVDDIIDSGNTMEKVIKESENKNVIYDALIIRDFSSMKDVGIWYVFPWEVGFAGEDNSREDIPLRMLQAIGENPGREGLIDTPKRVVKTWDELYGGYKQNPADILGSVFDNTETKYDEMVILKDIEFYSTCEHHMLPFFGRVHIAYIPTSKVIGVSKLARLVDCFACRLQIQERLTSQISEAIQAALNPLGVAVIIEAQHFCMTSRGIRKQNSVMVTSSLLGILKDSPAARAEFMALRK